MVMTGYAFVLENAVYFGDGSGLRNGRSRENGKEAAGEQKSMHVSDFFV
jgi:hypothetical protein